MTDGAPPPSITELVHEVARLNRELSNSQELVSRCRAQTQHRVRNLLSVIRAINSRSFERATSLEDLAMHQSGRISALARVEEALELSDGAHADLERLLLAEWLDVLSGPDEGRVQAHGPLVALKPRAAERLGLAFHELTTNALKFGALSAPAGRIEVDWALADDRLSIRWSERGVPVVNLSPKRVGFGRDLIERALPYDLHAETHLAFAAGGLDCALILPADEAVARIETPAAPPAIREAVRCPPPSRTTPRTSTPSSCA